MLFIWYPKCSTCQKAKAWLDARGAAYQARDIKQEHPTLDELRKWYKMSGMELKRFFNTSGMLYKEMKDGKGAQRNSFGSCTNMVV